MIDIYAVKVNYVHIYQIIILIPECIIQSTVIPKLMIVLKWVVIIFFFEVVRSLHHYHLDLTHTA